jgi:hypothetical protein
MSGWQQATGLDEASTFGGEQPEGVKTFVRPNRYEEGRAHIAVYNWAQQDSASVDVSGVLNAGDSYAVYHAYDLFGTPVATGTYSDGTIDVPLGTVAPPEITGGWVVEPPSAGPEFNAFVLIKTS